MSSLYAYLMGRRIEYLAGGDVNVSEEKFKSLVDDLKAVKVPEPEPEKKGKIGYILMGIMGFILSRK